MRSILLLDRLGINLLVFLASTIILDRDLLSKSQVNVLQTALLRFGKQKVDIDPVHRRWDDQNKEELPCDLVEGNRAGHEQNNRSKVQPNPRPEEQLSAHFASFGFER